MKSNEKFLLSSGRAEASALPGLGAVACSLDETVAGALFRKNIK